MPRFYCDFCDAYLTHDSVSDHLPCAALPVNTSTVADSGAALLNETPQHAHGCLSRVFGYHMLVVFHLQPAVRSQHNSGYKHKVRIAAR
jgi:hypothetical protein